MPQIRSVLGKKRARNKSLEPVVVESTPISQQPNFQQLLLDGLPSYTPAISVHLQRFSSVLSHMNPFTDIPVFCSASWRWLGLHNGLKTWKQQH
jgi:hypothetical protein